MMTPASSATSCAPVLCLTAPISNTSGPAGYTAGLYAARALLNPMVIAGYAHGGQLMLTSDVENFPGYTSPVPGPDMMQDLRKQAENFGAEVRTHSRDGGGVGHECTYGCVCAALPSTHAITQVWFR